MTQNSKCMKWGLEIWLMARWLSKNGNLSLEPNTHLNSQAAQPQNSAGAETPGH